LNQKVFIIQKVKKKAKEASNMLFPKLAVVSIFQIVLTTNAFTVPSTKLLRPPTTLFGNTWETWDDVEKPTKPKEVKRKGPRPRDTRYDHKADFSTNPPLNHRGSYFEKSAMDRQPKRRQKKSFEDWRKTGPQRLQGGSRRTFDDDEGRNQSGISQVNMETEGRAMDAEFEVWDGPDDTPSSMRVKSEDGKKYPFRAVVGTPGSRSAKSVRNRGGVEFPMSTGVSSVANTYAGGYIDTAAMRTIQGQALKTWPFPADVSSVEVTIVTDGRPMKAAVELWGANGHVKTVAEIYNNDGSARPFATVVRTPGSANTICVRNTGPIEFPIDVSCEPASFEDEDYDDFDDYDEYDDIRPAPRFERRREERYTPYNRHRYQETYSRDDFVNSPYGNGDRWWY